MPAALLLSLVELFKAVTQLHLQISSTMTPAQQQEANQRYLDSTKWMSDLLKKFSTDIEKLIALGSVPAK